MWPIKWNHYRWPLVTSKITFAVRKLAISHTSGNTTCVVYDMFTHESESACGLEFQLFFVNEGLLKVTISHVQCICGNVSGTVPDRVVINRKWYNGLSNRSNSDDPESASRSFLLQAVQLWFFVQLCAAVDKISTDSASLCRDSWASCIRLPE